MKRLNGIEEIEGKVFNYIKHINKSKTECVVAKVIAADKYIGLTIKALCLDRYLICISGPSSVYGKNYGYKFPTELYIEVMLYVWEAVKKGELVDYGFVKAVGGREEFGTNPSVNTCPFNS